MEVDHLKRNGLKKQLSEFIHSGYSKKQPFVLFKSIDEISIKAISSNQFYKVDSNFLQHEDKGFVFSSFRKDEKAERWFIPSEEYITFSVEDEVKIDGEKPEKTPFYCSTIENETTSKDAFVKTVEQAVEDIQQEKYKKVVLSKVKIEPQHPNWDILDSFLDLCEAYPQAFVNLVSLPNVGTWIGATPEVLINKTENTFTTVSLAGTQPATTSIKDAVWRQKEIEEQAFVNRYIVDCFKTIRLRFYKEIGPKTVQAGNLLHLKTVFQVNLEEQETEFPELANRMLNLLHPTSAVCGVPMQPSLASIKQKEQHNRKFYSGYLGPVNLDNCTQLYVNLRCAEIGEHLIAFYSGAGITEDSDPEKEWRETEMKCDTLLKFL